MFAAEAVHVDQLGIHHRRHTDAVVINKDFATGHPSTKVVPHRAKHHQGAAGHVLSRMLPHALDHC